MYNSKCFSLAVFFVHWLGNTGNVIRGKRFDNSDAVIPIRSETCSTMLVAISHASCRRRLHRVGCEKQALSKDLHPTPKRDISHTVDMTNSMSIRVCDPQQYSDYKSAEMGFISSASGRALRDSFGELKLILSKFGGTQQSTNKFAFAFFCTNFPVVASNAPPRCPLNHKLEEH